MTPFISFALKHPTTIQYSATKPGQLLFACADVPKRLCSSCPKRDTDDTRCHYFSKPETDYLIKHYPELFI